MTRQRLWLARRYRQSLAAGPGASLSGTHWLWHCDESLHRGREGPVTVTVEAAAAAAALRQALSPSRRRPGRAAPTGTAATTEYVWAGGQCATGSPSLCQ